MLNYGVMLPLTLSSVAALVAGLSLGVVLRSLKRIEGFESALTRLDSAEGAHPEVWGAVEGIAAKMNVLEDTLRDHTLAIAEGIERVDRSERRIRSAIGRARKRMERAGYVDDGLEAEAQGLLELDEDVGREEGVPPVQPAVAGPDPRVLASFPGDWRGVFGE